MTKGAWQSPDDIEAELFPKANGSFVRGYDKIELHCAKTKSARFAQTMLAHFAPHSQALCVWCNHKGGIRDVTAGTGLIRS